MERIFRPLLLNIKRQLRKNKTKAYLRICDLYSKLAKELFLEYYSSSNEKHQKMIREVFKAKKKRIEDSDKIGLGDWIGIYRALGLFNKLGNKYFKADLLDSINKIRVSEAHPFQGQFKLPNSVNVEDAYISLVNALLSKKLVSYDHSFGLCEYCFEELAKSRHPDSHEKRVGAKCLEKLKIVEEYSKNLEEQIKLNIFEIINISFPKFDEIFEKYMAEKIELEHPVDFFKRMGFYEKLRNGEDLTEAEIKRVLNYEKYWEKEKELLLEDEFFNKKIRPIFEILFSLCKQRMNDSLSENYHDCVLQELSLKYIDRLPDIKKFFRELKKKYPKEKIQSRKYPFKFVMSLVPLEFYFHRYFEPYHMGNVCKIVEKDLRLLKGDDYLIRLKVLRFMYELISEIAISLKEINKVEIRINEYFGEGEFCVLGKTNLENFLNSLLLKKSDAGKFLMYLILRALSAES